MKTWQSILAHIGITAIQAVVAAPVLSGTGQGSTLGNTGIQIGAQLGLTLLQGWIASKNSNTDPNGNKLAQGVDGKFTTVK